MKRILIIILFFLLGNKMTFSQESDHKFFLTKEENKEWISDLKKTTLIQGQITKIKKKIISDSIYKRSTKYFKAGNYLIGDRLVLITDDKIREDRYISDCECKIIFYIEVRKEAYLLDINRNKNTIKVLELINNNNIDKILMNTKSTFFEFKTGIRWCGIITMLSTNKSLKRDIKNVL